MGKSQFAVTKLNIRRHIQQVEIIKSSCSSEYWFKLQVTYLFDIHGKEWYPVYEVFIMHFWLRIPDWLFIHIILHNWVRLPNWLLIHYDVLLVQINDLTSYSRHFVQQTKINELVNYAHQCAQQVKIAELAFDSQMLIVWR